MFNADRLLSDLVGGGLFGGGRGRKRYRHRGGGLGDVVGRTVMSPQGLTILGGLAIAAYEHFKGRQDSGGAGQPGGPGPSGQPPRSGTPGPAASAESTAPGRPLLPATPPPFVPSAASGLNPAGGLTGGTPEAPGGSGVGGVDRGSPVGEERARLLITAMVSAARADGIIDPQERARILGQLAERGAGDAERAYLEEEMARPLDLDRLISQVRDPVLAAEVYAASLLAIDPDTPAEKAYLSLLAVRLGLDPGMIQELETRLDTAGA